MIKLGPSSDISHTFDRGTNFLKLAYVTSVTLKSHDFLRKKSVICPSLLIKSIVPMFSVLVNPLVTRDESQDFQYSVVSYEFLKSFISILLLSEPCLLKLFRCLDITQVPFKCWNFFRSQASYGHVLFAGPQDPRTPDPGPKTPEVNVNNFHPATFYIKVLEDG